MADLTSADITVTISRREIIGKSKRALVLISYGDGAKTYPTNGIPLPAVTQCGVKNGIDFVNMMPPPGNGYVYKYDKTNHTIRIYQDSGSAAPMAEVSAHAPAATVIDADIWGR